MYHRAGDRDWHHGHHQRDGPQPRNHMPLPYRGGYRDHREHDSYGQYHDYGEHHDYGPYDYGPCQERNYNDNHYMDNREHPYHEDVRPYNGYRDTRGQGYYREGRHDNSYQKDSHARYQQSHPRMKYPYKSPKPHRNDDMKAKPDTPTPAQSVVHNTSPTIIILTDYSSENIPSKNRSPEQEDSKPVQDVAILKENNISTQHKTKLPDDEAKLTEGGAEPSEEDIELSDENQELSKEATSLSDEGKNLNEGIKIKQEDGVSDLDDESVEPVCATTQNATDMAALFPCSTECLIDNKEDILQTQSIIKEEEIPLPITAVKRAHSDDSEDFCFNEYDTEEESFLSKRTPTWQDEDQFHMEKTVEIPLLDGWADMLSDSADMPSTSTSTRGRTEQTVECGQPETTKELRKAYILARKEEIELAFSQDCRTFAFVANMLLKKDPSMEVPVINALRSTLQDIAEHCVQELESFVEKYE